MCKKLFTVVVIVLITVVASAQSFNTKKLDSFMNLLAANNKAMGSVAILKNGHLLYANATGFSSISAGKKTAANTNTKYRVGSISKMFTAVIIFQLMEEGKLKLNSLLATYYPTIPNAKKITISNLLNHRSGLHNITDDEDYTKWMTKPKTHEQLITMFSRSKADFEPGEKAEYSNTNYILLGYIIEKITKKTYAKNLQERISAKLALKNTYYGSKTNTGNNESYSYTLENDWVQEPETDMSIPGGAGAIVSTPTDLTKFIQGLFSLKLVKAASLSQMQTIKDGYGMAMFEIPFYDKKGLGHNGGIDGFTSSLVYFKKDSVAVAYCSNGVNYKFNDVLIGILSIYYNKEYELPKFGAAYAYTTDELDKYTGVYASEKMPLKITITRNGINLMAQATGQSAFTLQATEKDKFQFDAAGIKLEFNTTKGEMLLKQGGDILFKKE